MTEPKQTGYDLSFSSSWFLQPVPGSTPLSLSLSPGWREGEKKGEGSRERERGWKFCSACVIRYVSGHGHLADRCYTDGIIDLF